MNSFWTLVFHSALAVVCIGVLVVGAIAIAPQYAQWCDFTERRDDLQRQCEQKERKLNALKEKLHRLQNDPEFVERIAREQKMVKADEIMFIPATESAE
jgi:Septum formation initiator.